MRLGIRLQILFSLGALLLISFLPLYVAVARLTEASQAAARRDAAHDLGRAVASHVLSARKTRSTESLQPLLDAQLSEAGVTSIGVYDESGKLVVSSGESTLLPSLTPPLSEQSRDVASSKGRCLLIVVPTEHGDGAVALTLALARPDVEATALVRLVALYTGVVALGLLVFAYFAMTRLVVRPVEDVSRAAGRVAAGSRSFSIATPTARELAELCDSLRSMTDKLLAEEEALRAKVAELEAAKRELESAQETVVRSERLASVGRLAAGVAHEIGNPIAAILGFEELLLASDLPEDERRDFLLRMKAETERVNRVLRDLLDFARPRSRPAADADARASVREATDLVVTLVKPQKRLGDVDVDVVIGADLPDVAISLERLQQVLLNLIFNAADAAKSRIELRADRAGPGIEIRISDDGPGIADNVKDRLFEPFVTTKDVGKGTGLGLAVCRGLVEAAGGTISLGTSELGGACFILALPVAPSPA